MTQCLSVSHLASAKVEVEKASQVRRNQGMTFSLWSYHWLDNTIVVYHFLIFSLSD